MDHRVSRAITELTQRKGRSPKIVEIARAVDLDEHDVHEVLHARESLRFLSLDEEREGDDGAPIAQRDRITTKQASVSMPHEDQVLIADAVERLSGLQRKVIYYLFYLDLTQTEAAQKLGISQKHVSRVMHAALKRLRETMRPEAV
jgi:RNA polymerase sigma-B factor